MTDVDQYEQFAKAYGDPTSPTYNNARATYQFLNPHVTPDSAKKAGSRMLKDERVRRHLVEYRRKMGVLAAKSHEDYLVWGWETLDEMKNLMVADAKYAGALAKLFETMGKAHGYLVTKTEDLTPLERKAPISPAEAQTLLEQRLARFKKINEPNPLPAIAASIPPETVPAVEEAEHTILPRDDESPKAPLDAVHAERSPDPETPPE